MKERPADGEDGRLKLEKLIDLAAATVPCPYCSVALTPTAVRVAGMPIIVDARCPDCRGEFAFDWPAGHALLHPTLVDRKTGALHASGADWYARRFAHCLASEAAPATPEITVNGSCHADRAAILVNCLDFRYSHVLLKLMSEPRHAREHPDDDIVVIVPRLLRWLVPAGVVVIEVDMPLGRPGTDWIEGLDATVDEVLAPAATVQISPAVSQPNVRLQDLTRLAQDLTRAPNMHSGTAPPQIGFALRSDLQHNLGDRLWLGPQTLWLRTARHFFPDALSQRVLLRRQHRNYARLADRIREQHPDARFVAFGIGEPRGLPDYVHDLRTAEPVREESPWLDEYRRCRVVVGVHGANLLLPSLLAGAVIDLLPTFKLPNINQDLLIPEDAATNPKSILFHYRIIPEESTPHAVAAIALSIIDDADGFHHNMMDNLETYQTPGWPRTISWRQIA